MVYLGLAALTLAGLLVIFLIGTYVEQWNRLEESSRSGTARIGLLHETQGPQGFPLELPGDKERKG